MNINIMLYPTTEVKKQQGNDATYIETSSDCVLHIGQRYSVHCEPEGLKIQPNVSQQSWIKCPWK